LERDKRALFNGSLQNLLDGERKVRQAWLELIRLARSHQETREETRAERQLCEQRRRMHQHFRSVKEGDVRILALVLDPKYMTPGGKGVTMRTTKDLERKSNLNS